MCWWSEPPKGGHVHVGGGLCSESGSAWVTWNWVPKIYMCDSLPEGCSRLFDDITQQVTMVDVATRRRGRKVQVLEVRGGWRVENELAKTQIDAVNTDVINKESVRPWSVEGEVLCVSYSVLGIYFGRRR